MRSFFQTYFLKTDTREAPTTSTGFPCILRRTIPCYRATNTFYSLLFFFYNIANRRSEYNKQNSYKYPIYHTIPLFFSYQLPYLAEPLFLLIYTLFLLLPKSFLIFYNDEYQNCYHNQYCYQTCSKTSAQTSCYK